MALEDVEFGSYTFVNPEFSPYLDDNFNGTWITIEARDIKEITAETDSGTGGLIISDEIKSSWRFLAPESIQENVIHDWEPWETISTRLAGMGVNIRNIGAEVPNLVKSFMIGAKKFSLKPALNQLSKVTRAPNKVDTPLIYKDSQRMEWTMTFNLISERHGFREIMFPVRRLQELSSPTRTGEATNDGSIDVIMPCCFSIRSETFQNQYGGEGSGYKSMKGMINIDQTALTSIQPTYMSPYDKDGYPMRCELTLTFKQLPPLYSDSFGLEFGSIDPGPVI